MAVLAKPTQWSANRALVAPRYRGFWRDASVVISSLEGDVTPRDLISGLRIDGSLSGSATQLQHTKVGRLGRGHFVDVDEGGWRLLLSTGIAQSWQDSDKSKATFAFACDPGDIFGLNAVWGFHGANNPSTGLWCSNNDRIRFRVETSGGDFDTADIFLDYTKTHVFIGRWEQGNLQDLHHYLNGVWDASVSAAADTNPSVAENYVKYMRALAGVTSREFQGIGHIAVAANRVWTRAEMDLWAADPHGMVRMDQTIFQIGRTPDVEVGVVLGTGLLDSQRLHSGVRLVS